MQCKKLRSKIELFVWYWFGIKQGMPMKRIVLIALLLVSKIAYGGLREEYGLEPITKIEDLGLFQKIVEKISDQCPEDVVFVFDKDDTLMFEQTACLQSRNAKKFEILLLKRFDYWAYEMKELYTKIFCASINQIKLVDPKLVDIIQRLNQKKCKSLILTTALHWEYGIFNPITPIGVFQKLGIDSKIESFADFNIFRLKQLGISFYPWIAQDKVPEAFNREFDGRYEKSWENPLYKDGFVFCAYSNQYNAGKRVGRNRYNEKYLVLLRLFCCLDWLPKVVIWIDDNLDDLLGGKEQCEKGKIEFIGFHYLGVQKHLRDFIEQVAEMQLDYAEANNFQDWLEDGVALQQLQAGL